MQATVIHNSKGQTEEDGPQKNSKQNKKDALRDRNLKRYINQCQVSKATCEKRIRSLGGPDYRYYGLGHGQPFQGRQKKHSKTQRRERLKSTKILAFADIMDHTLARSFLMVFLDRHDSGNLLRLDFFHFVFYFFTLYKKCSFPLRISSLNVTKSLMENFFCAVLFASHLVKSSNMENSTQYSSNVSSSICRSYK